MMSNEEAEELKNAIVKYGEVCRAEGRQMERLDIITKSRMNVEAKILAAVKDAAKDEEKPEGDEPTEKKDS